MKKGRRDLFLQDAYYEGRSMDGLLNDYGAAMIVSGRYQRDAEIAHSNKDNSGVAEAVKAQRQEGKRAGRARKEINKAIKLLEVKVTKLEKLRKK